MQAWLDAYHGVTSGQEGILLAGDLSGRAGSIQAAINLEFHAMKITSIDVKVLKSFKYQFYIDAVLHYMSNVIIIADRRIEWTIAQSRSF